MVGKRPSDENAGRARYCLPRRSTIVAVAECKWTNKQVDALVLKTLDRRAALAGADSKAYRYVFSKSGFTDDCKRYADQSTNFILIKFESMVVCE